MPSTPFKIAPHNVDARIERCTQSYFGVTGEEFVEHLLVVSLILLVKNHVVDGELAVVLR